MDISSPVRKLVMVGACYVDTILSVPHFPQEDHKLRAQSLARRRGGNVANTLEVLQQLPIQELELILLSVLPARDSPGSKLVRDSLATSVSTEHCVYREDHLEPASSYIIKADDTGSRTIVNYNELPDMQLQEFKDKVINGIEGDGCRMWFHFEGREVETSVACMRWLRERYPDVLLSAEIEKPNREGLDQMAAEADVVFFSKTWAEAQGYSTFQGLLDAQVKTLSRPSLLICTWGADGAGVIRTKDRVSRNGKVLLREGQKVVDTVGAGDTFTAGVLYALLSGEHEDVALKSGNKLAARKVLQEGFGNLSLDE